jgi:hypothetical protein
MTPALERGAVCVCGELVAAHRSPRTGRWISCLELHERREAEAAAACCTTATVAEQFAAGARLLAESRY